VKKKNAKLVSAVLAMSLVFAGCGTTATTDSSDTEADTASDVTEEASEEATEEAADDTTASDATSDVTASVDFEDGNFAFAAVNTSLPNADSSVLSVVDFNGSQALKMENQGGSCMYLGINTSALLGDAVADLATISFDIGTEFADGNFYASSGYLYAYTGEDNEQNKLDAVSVYVESSNPKTATIDVSSAGFVAGCDNFIIISKETDNATSDGVQAGNMYIDNIVFMDASGNVLEADTSAEFGSPANFASSGVDRSNLYGAIKATPLDAFAGVSGDGWAQNGIDLTEDQIASLVPGTAIEISYTADTGNMWIVMPDATAGWMRVGVGDADGSGQGYAYKNNSKNTVQITYDQIAQYCGEDTSTWGTRIQCESDGAWQVNSAQIVTTAPNYVIQKGAVDFEGFEVSGDGWSQAGVAMTDEIKAALVPGAVVEISYSSDTGKIWLVMNEAEAGWMRVGVGDTDGSGQGYITADGSKAYVPYELIAEYCGEDVSTWGSTMQCESDGAWEVYGIRVGTAGEIVPNNYQVDLGAAVSGDGWAQNGVDLTEDMIAALVPGSVINISYASETGEIWIVMPDATAGWMRVGVGDYDGSGQGYVLCTGNSAQITYEMIAEFCGDDVSTWGTRIQFEATSAWEVYSASIGTVK